MPQLRRTASPGSRCTRKKHLDHFAKQYSSQSKWTLVIHYLRSTAEASFGSAVRHIRTRKHKSAGPMKAVAGMEDNSTYMYLLPANVMLSCMSTAPHQMVPEAGLTSSLIRGRRGS
ncbi:predicted protein [Chaetomium globosum CBS 148.51]|uniref:Uncharacterized protein n=1 Tax=Chaetomium globosum (strain ATCC 6205 / CBS 148.51 / DSM 1962 / NBRC 6347 / NRRL 1970) TaxID=306901 RepID=Q2GXL7_CHAGB|nr:uncharacterized protein CHGG_07287 [Chaetomium globosum CBS 148.51]EAQ86034.1 predicted protein [Chaetomium globosum CBS 148.51]